jgi:hypothetical protein
MASWSFVIVQKDQPVRLKPHDRLARQGPFLARLLDIGPIMLAGPGRQPTSDLSSNYAFWSLM